MCMIEKNTENRENNREKKLSGYFSFINNRWWKL